MSYLTKNIIGVLINNYMNNYLPYHPLSQCPTFDFLGMKYWIGNKIEFHYMVPKWLSEGVYFFQSSFYPLVGDSALTKSRCQNTSARHLGAMYESICAFHIRVHTLLHAHPKSQEIILSFQGSVPLLFFERAMGRLPGTTNNPPSTCFKSCSFFIGHSAWRPSHSSASAGDLGSNVGTNWDDGSPWLGGGFNFLRKLLYPYLE